MKWGIITIMNITNLKKTIVLITLLTVVFVYYPLLLEVFLGGLSLGELLSFYASIFGALITLVGVVMTLNYQTRQSMSDDEIKYKPILKIDLFHLKLIWILLGGENFIFCFHLVIQ